jgi:hypothetical protein
MNDSPALETDLLIGGCLKVSRVTGIPAQYLVSHALLFATAAVGGAACYRTHPDQAPQLVGSPATILSREDVCPHWFEAATRGALELQERITARAKSGKALGLTHAQVRSAKRLAKMHAPLQRIMPSPLQDAMIHGSSSLAPTSFQFLHDVRNGSVRKEPALTHYGPHLLALAQGGACYRDLLGKRLQPNSLHAAAASPSAASRVTIHGWADFPVIRGLLRRQGMEVMAPFGFLLEVPAMKEQPFMTDGTWSLYLQFFHLVLEWRTGCPMYFSPEPEITEILNAGVREQAERSRSGGMPSEVANPRPMLAWNIATILWAIERSVHAYPENIRVLAERACRISRFIHELHVHTLRGIFPTLQNGTTDPMNAAIIDKLSVEPLHLRQLMRKIHRSGAEDLRNRLGFLENDGVVRRDPDGKWRVRPFPVENFADIAVSLSAETQNPPPGPVF